MHLISGPPAAGRLAPPAVLPMPIVDPGFRPRRLLEDAQALELVRRAADASAAAGEQKGAAPAAASASACVPLAPMDPALTKLFQHHRDGDTVASVQVAHVQRLWGGMGAVFEVRAETASSGVSALLIVKKILLPAADGALSHGDQRKKASYECEAKFFEAMAGQLRRAGCSVPIGLLVDSPPGIINIVMSKMPGSATLSELEQENAASKLAAQYKEYGQRVYSSESDEPDQNSDSLSPSMTAATIDFLARIHGHTWGSARAVAAVAAGLQPQGGHWYLDTRQDEWEAMLTCGWEGRLRRAARAIDYRLKQDVHQCIIHGDAKPDNMCYNAEGAMSMCDFQYCGRANPMKDLAYLLCCAAGAGCSPASSEAHLARYHAQLSAVLSGRGAAAEIPPLADLKSALNLAYADLCRWMSGRGYWGDVPSLQCVVAVQSCPPCPYLALFASD